MLFRFIILISLLFATSFAQEEQFKTNEIGIVEHEGVNYKLISEVDEYSGALFVLKQSNDSWETVAGDSSPFPLDQYGLSEELSLKLAKAFVAYEHKTMGLEAIKSNLAEREKLPWDLLKAYSEIAEVNHIRAVYRAKESGVSPMIQALKKVEVAQGADQLKQVLLKDLSPYFHKIIIQIADEPKTELAQAIFRALKSHPTNIELQQIVAVYAANQERDFLKELNTLPQDQRRKVSEALDSAVMAKLVGSKFVPKLTELVKTIR